MSLGGGGGLRYGDTKKLSIKKNLREMNGVSRLSTRVYAEAALELQFQVSCAFEE